MPDAQGNPTAEERFVPKLPKQIQDQVDAVNAAINAGPQPLEDQQGPEGPASGHEEFDDGNQEEGYDPQEEGQGPPEEESWEQRARSAAGRLEQSLAANQQMARRISELEMQVSGRQLQPPPGPPPGPDQYAKPQLIKEEERTDYGEEFFDVVGRRAREEFSPELMALGERMKRLESGQQAVGQVIEKTQKRGVYDQLYEEIPNWRQINNHPLFKQWVTQIDPYSGRPLAEMLNEAVSRHDGQRVVNFFRGFAEAAGLPLNPSSPGPSAPPLPGNGQASERPSLEDFAAPGRARSAPQAMPPDKPVYTAAQVAQISDAKRRGLWRGREAELEAIERDIFAAQHEGRLIQ